MLKLKRYKYYFIAVIVLIIGIILIFNKFVIAGLVILGIGALIFSLWEFLLKDRESKIDLLKDEIQRMKIENQSLRQDINELSSRRLNITEINDILDLGLIEVDTSFKRTVNKSFDVTDKQVQFIGVLHVDFVAKYGIDFRKLQYKIDEERKEISIANANPQFLSFSKRNCVWEIAEILEYNKPFIGAKHWKTNPRLDKLATQIKEEIRTKTERETENGPKELDWVIWPLRKHVEMALELILGMKGYKIRLTELDDGNYKPLNEYAKDAGALEGSTKL
ncbi:MAG: hypothetical protein JXA61_04465 [Bacteroidales bacterium]|nr:hypothetical protein [Bacteroidales bacterium]